MSAVMVVGRGGDDCVGGCMRDTGSAGCHSVLGSGVDAVVLMLVLLVLKFCR